MEEGSLFIYCVATSKEPEAYRTGQPQEPADHSISTTRLGGGIGVGTEPALSYQPGSVKLGREERVSQSIWSRPTNSVRCLKKKSPIREYRGKINLGHGPYDFREAI